MDKDIAPIVKVADCFKDIRVQVMPERRRVRDGDGGGEEGMKDEACGGELA